MFLEDELSAYADQCAFVDVLKLDTVLVSS